jgi:predicted kinase
MLNFETSLVIFCGLPFTGKSTLSRELARLSNFVHHDCDVYRLAIVGNDHFLPDEQEAEVMLESYRRMHVDGLSRISSHLPVSIAATYWRPIYKPLLADLLSQISCPIRIFELEVDDDFIGDRVRQRILAGDPSEIKTVEQYVVIKNRIDPIAFQGKIAIDTSRSIPDTLDEVLSHLHGLRRM